MAAWRELGEKSTLKTGFGRFVRAANGVALPPATSERDQNLHSFSWDPPATNIALVGSLLNCAAKTMQVVSELAERHSTVSTQFPEPKSQICNASAGACQQLVASGCKVHGVAADVAVPQRPDGVAYARIPDLDCVVPAA
eukprot:CAMPEP_0170653750 /NCGR_PEP_ID=MMETSP0224-20130122/47566_1 /TAXON_ID=285029 /ORGANISM="Togula jolla, Strain CCCM 725" /LENGTH=139 /DNA_ID=CAMNT_0010985627 /DNA_START=188 /DNA_END=611 /DNA_ORIENTATION=-